MKYLLLLLLLPTFSFSQDRIDFARYTSVWVADKNPDPKSWIPDEIHSIDNNIPASIRKSNSLTVFIPDSNRVILNNQSVYILAYLTNSSCDTIVIDRCDATIYPAETQILVNGEWKLFQISMGSSCGNSYFKAQLPPQSYYILNINRPKPGDIETMLRVKFKFGDKEYFSNACKIFLTDEEIQKAGKSIQPLSF
jgi:hypothetical protein